jgi:hypothetical protein
LIELFALAHSTGVKFERRPGAFLQQDLLGVFREVEAEQTEHLIEKLIRRHVLIVRSGLRDVPKVQIGEFLFGIVREPVVIILEHVRQIKILWICRSHHDDRIRE